MLKKTHVIIILSLVLNIPFLSYSQTASIIFDGSTNFQVTINHIKQHNSYNNNIKINNLEGDKSYNVKINFENDTAFVQTNIYLIDNGLAHIYTVSQKKMQLKKVVPAASYSGSENQLSLNYIINNNLPVDTILKDTIIKDTAYVVPFASYYKMEDYEGKVGCPFPIKDDDLIALKNEIRKKTLEESKLEFAKEKIQEMDSVCFTIDQTKDLLLLFEYEETRLDFAKSIASFIFDIDNVGKLEIVFDFENSLEELKKLFGIHIAKLEENKNEKN